MATLTIRNLDNELTTRLRVVAAQHGHSMEEEVRCILHRVLAQPPSARGLGSRIHQRFAALGGGELELAKRIELPRPAHLPE